MRDFYINEQGARVYFKADMNPMLPLPLVEYGDLGKEYRIASVEMLPIGVEIIVTVKHNEGFNKAYRVQQELKDWAKELLADQNVLPKTFEFGIDGKDKKAFVMNLD